MNNLKTYLICAVFALLGSPVWAGNVTIPNTFVSGTPAKASEVNDNFSAVKTAVDDNDARLTNLESVKTGYVSVSSMNATPYNSTLSYLQCQIGIVGKALNSGGLNYLDVNIQIPDGATIIGFTYVAYDGLLTYLRRGLQGCKLLCQLL